MSINAELFNFTAGDRMADLARVGRSQEYEERVVSIYDIDEHPKNREVRQSKVDELSKSILEDGLGQWPLVRVSPFDESRYEHIAGWHRILAYRKIYEELKPGDKKYEKITVIVKMDCDDKTSERLMAATNLFSTDLTEAERGQCYVILGEQAQELREAYPEKYKGMRTNDIVADIASSNGKPVSEATIKRAKKAYKDSLNPSNVVRKEKPNPNANKELKALEKGLDKLEAYTENSLDVDIDRLSLIVNRAQVILDEIKRK